MKDRNGKEQSSLQNKWSCKPPDHNTIRVRNNQRRHRARVKSRIEDLEQQLGEANRRLEAALSTIGSLTAELESMRSQHRPSSPLAHPSASSAEQHARGPAPPVLDTRAQDSQHTIAGPADGELSTLQASSSTAVTGPTGHNPGAAVRSPLAMNDVDNGTDCNCRGLPPPAPGESTVSCSSAFQIIDQQNFIGVEVTTIRAWLDPGFRKGPRPGEACRVETNRLYELLDYITSST